MCVRTRKFNHFNDDRRRTGTGNNAANITDHVTANTADLLGILHHTNGSPTAGHPARRHRGQGRDITVRDRHPDPVEDDTDDDKQDADQQRHDQIAFRRDDFGEKTEKRRKEQRDNRHFQRPKIALDTLSFRSIFGKRFLARIRLVPS